MPPTIWERSNPPETKASTIRPTAIAPVKIPPLESPIDQTGEQVRTASRAQSDTATLSTLLDAETTSTRRAAPALAGQPGTASAAAARTDSGDESFESRTVVTAAVVEAGRILFHPLEGERI